MPRLDQSVSQSLQYHTPSRELMAHTLTLLKHESGYGGYLWTKVKYRVEGDVFYLLRFFLTKKKLVSKRMA